MTVKLGPAARHRCYFEHDDEWPDEFAWLVDAMDRAADAAFRSARSSVLDGSGRERALWDEAVVETIERILHSRITNDEDVKRVELPTFPRN